MDTWFFDEPLTKNMVLTVLALIRKVPDVAQQHELISTDIGSDAMIPICFEYRHLRGIPDEHGWKLLALATQLRRPRKIRIPFDGADRDSH